MLFHRNVFWPSRLNRMLPQGEFFCEYSEHAKREAKSDRYGNISLPHSVKLNLADVFEVEQESKGGPITKFCLRQRLDETRDLILAVIPKRGTLFVKTVWVNVNSDCHKTLNPSKYWKP